MLDPIEQSFYESHMQFLQDIIDRKEKIMELTDDQKKAARRAASWMLEDMEFMTVLEDEEMCDWTEGEQEAAFEYITRNLAPEIRGE